MRQFIVAKKRSLEDFLDRHHNVILPLILVGGFVGDTLTLNQVDQVFDNMVLLAHILIVATSITLLFGRSSALGKRFRVSDRESTISAIMLFSFGGLFSGFTIFYSKSGSLISSWPFILALLLLMLATEVRKTYYKNALLQISIFYVAIFSYLIFLVPVLLRKMGPAVYIFSGLVSLLVIFLYTLLLGKVDRRRLRDNRQKLIIRIVSIFLAFNLLYFTNIIPPIPLSLKFRAVYHDFSSIQGIEYKGLYEQPPALMFWKKRSGVFHWKSGEDVYVYSQIYAPVYLNVDIYHVWEYFDPVNTRWVETNQVRIPITGGRAEGYRGFSKKSAVFPGSWRVKVTTERGQEIGEIRFRIKEGVPTRRLTEEVFR